MKKLINLSLFVLVMTLGSSAYCDQGQHQAEDANLEKKTARGQELRLKELAEQLESLEQLAKLAKKADKKDKANDLADVIYEHVSKCGKRTYGCMKLSAVAVMFAGLCITGGTVLCITGGTVYYIVSHFPFFPVVLNLTFSN